MLALMSFRKKKALMSTHHQETWVWLFESYATRTCMPYGMIMHVSSVRVMEAMAIRDSVRLAVQRGYV